MSEVDDLAREYEKAQQKLREIRRLLTDRIIKHLIGRSVGPGACTEVGVSRILGMPRTTVRNVMQDLISEGVLYQEPTRSRPAFKPYTVKSVVCAMEKGYVSFTKEEFDRLFAVMEKGEDDGYGSWGMPFVGGEVNGKPIYRFLTGSLRNSLRDLTTRFREFEVKVSVSDLLGQAYGEEDQRRIVLMCPEYELLNDLVKTDWFPLGSWIPYEDLEPSPSKPEEAKKLLCEGIESKLRLAMACARRFLDISGKEGFAQYAERFAQERGKGFPMECVWAYAISLRHAARLGKAVGISDDIVDQCEKMACELDALVGPVAERAGTRPKAEGRSR